MQKITITDNNSGERLDKFLSYGNFFEKTISRGEISRQIREGNILVNEKKVKASYSLREGDVITLQCEFGEEEISLPKEKKELSLIFVDENIIVVDKPAGMQVHPDSKHKEDTLVNYLVFQFPEIKKVCNQTKETHLRPGIVHRLDRDTSGVLVVARKTEVFSELKRQFQNREIEKKYQAIVYGAPDPAVGRIEKALARSTDYRRQVVAGRKTKTKIRQAVTEYRMLKNWDNAFALLELTPKTGRMHQLRVHLTFLGHPIVGDKKYFLREQEKFNFVKRQLLHAQSIKFRLFGKDYVFSSPLPQDFLDFSRFLDENSGKR